VWSYDDDSDWILDGQQLLREGAQKQNGVYLISFPEEKSILARDGTDIATPEPYSCDVWRQPDELPHRRNNRSSCRIFLGYREKIRITLVHWYYRQWRGPCHLRKPVFEETAPQARPSSCRRKRIDWLSARTTTFELAHITSGSRRTSLSVTILPSTSKRIPEGWSKRRSQESTQTQILSEECATLRLLFCPWRDEVLWKLCCSWANQTFYTVRVWLVRRVIS